MPQRRSCSPADCRRKCSRCRARCRSISKATARKPPARRRQCRHRALRRQRRIVYIPGAAAVTPAMLARMEGADIVFFDGTLFRDDEMIATGTGAKTGRRMGHMPIDGEEGSLAALDGLAARRIYIHINNTNPILVDGSPERRASRPRVGKSRTTEWRSCCEAADAGRTRSGAARHRRAALSRAASVPSCCCTAANAPRARCRPGRSIVTITRR